jgi:hypothetical protein
VLREHPALVGKEDPNAEKLDAKEQASAVPEPVAQVKLDQIPAQDLTLPKDTRKRALALMNEFSQAGQEYQLVKKELDEKKTGLSDVMFRLAYEAAGASDERPQYRAGMFAKLCTYVEDAALKAYKQANPQAEKVNLNLAISTSWRTYKSQYLRSMDKGYDPRDFASATAYRQVATPTISRRAGGEVEAGATDAAVVSETILDLNGIAADETVGPTMDRLIKDVHAALAANPDQSEDIKDVLDEALNEIAKYMPAKRPRGRRAGRDAEVAASASEAL